MINRLFKLLECIIILNIKLLIIRNEVIAMKKLMLLVTAIMVLAIVNSCGNKTKSPVESAMEYARHIHDGNYDKFVEHIYIDEIEPAEVEAKAIHPDKAEHAKILKKKVEPHIQDRGGLKNLNYIAETIAPDGKSAVVTLQNEYNNGQIEDVIYNMVLVDNDWKVRVGQDKEVWRTTLDDGTHLSFTLKEDDNKEVFKEHIGDERNFVKEKETDTEIVEKEKKDGQKDVLKIKDKGDEVVIKEKHDGEKTVTKIK